VIHCIIGGFLPFRLCFQISLVFIFLMFRKPCILCNMFVYTCTLVKFSFDLIGFVQYGHKYVSQKFVI